MNHNETERLRAQFDSLQEQYAAVCRDRDALRECAANALVLLWDYDGYYCRNKGDGDATALAGLIDDAYRILNGKHWTEPKPEGIAEVERLKAENRALRQRSEIAEYYWDRERRDSESMRRELDAAAAAAAIDGKPYNPPYGVGWGKGKDE
jgi:hypothetical protein